MSRTLLQLKEEYLIACERSCEQHKAESCGQRVSYGKYKNTSFITRQYLLTTYLASWERPIFYIENLITDHCEDTGEEPEIYISEASALCKAMEMSEGSLNPYALLLRAVSTANNQELFPARDARVWAEIKSHRGHKRSSSESFEEPKNKRGRH